jgi:hypothetical protein
MPDEPEPQSAEEPQLVEPPPQPEGDPFGELRGLIADYGEYDERAMDQYRALSHYFAYRKAGAPRGQAASATCAIFGHDAPRGLCLRCGLGVDLGADTSRQERQRLAERDAWLASRY